MSQWKKYLRILIPAIALHLQHSAYGQAELAPWGNITGVRIEGQLFPFETRLVLAQQGNTKFTATGKEKQRPVFKREGAAQVVTTTLGDLNLTERVQPNSNGYTTVQVTAVAKENIEADALLFAIKINDDKALKALAASSVKETSYTVNGESITLKFDKPVSFQVRKEEVQIPVHTGNLAKGDSITYQFSFNVKGKADKSPVELMISQSPRGNVFDGFGGNFRLQNPKTDPQVIDYCLDNMRVAWGRVEMPWRFWQPKIDEQPLDAAKAGTLHPAVKAAMEMAQRLYKKGMPVILSAWSAPAWAVVGEPKFQPGPDGVWGNPLNEEHTSAIYKSIADYIAYLKTGYGVEISYFSFNESDLGINIRQTPAEHAALIKGLGAYLEKRGLKTRLLLGDNSDATTYSFIDAAMDDPATLPYIGAVSFHSWRGWEKATLEKWAAAAKRVSRPLIVGEGSIDAQAWGYPAIFEEPTYALDEINLYIRLLNICQPASILQWQLTADYSPLAGGGIFGDKRPLQPTQRFWNLKQLAATPAGLSALPATSSKESITVAALGNDDNLVVHLVNNGASRKAVIKGLPANIKTLKVTATNHDYHMKELTSIPVRNGVAELQLLAGTYTTLTK